MHRAVLGLAGLLLLLFCLPWGSIALYGVLGAFPYETGGVCNAGRPLWAIGQLVVAIAGIVFTGKVSIAAMATAAQERHDAGRRWLGLGYALLAIGAWLLLVLVLEPEGTPVAAAECACRAPLIEPTLIIQPTKQVVVIQSTPLPTIIPTANPEECFNNLDFVDDVTVPDNSFITYGATIDKQWLVENSGTCNWNATYRLKHLGGAELGAPPEIMLYPAKAGTQATIQIIFTAPFTDGVYESAWQAYDPDNNPFGDPIYIRVTVAAP